MALEPLVGGIANPGSLAAHSDFLRHSLWEALGSRLRDINFPCPASQFLTTFGCPKKPANSARVSKPVS